MGYLEHLSKGLGVVPAAASVMAGRLDTLALVLLIVCTALTLAVIILVAYFGYHYRAGSNTERGPLPSERSHHVLEIGFSVALLVFFMGLLGWSGTLYLDMYRGPSDVRTIDVIGKQWMWKTQHANGVREINTLHVPTGEQIRLSLISQDVVHSFYVPALRLKHDVLPGGKSHIWFTATKPGEYHLFCAEYCGTDHSRMRGKVVVMQPANYQRWLAKRSSGNTPQQAGKQLFVSQGCSGCHMGRSSVRAPVLAGIYGRAVPLSNGTTVTANEAYLRDSILQPRKQVVAGFKPIMPSFANRIGEGDLQRIIAYLKSLQPGDWEQGSVRVYESSSP